MNEFSWRTRRATLTNFAQEAFDVLIIGGGITGAGLALDAAARGLSVALVEKRDFAAGTSSRSTKLIHGGLRYLEHFDFALVREALRERHILTRVAPHLAESYPFVIPIYEDARRNYDHPLKMRAGLLLYDLLAGRYNLGRHRRLSRAEALQLAPQLDPQGLRGAFLYYDARTDDARLVIAVLKAAHERGAKIANYVRVTGFRRDEDGQVNGVALRDELTGAPLCARARQVINATGVWMEETLRLSANGQSAAALPAKSVRPSKGVHLTIAVERLRIATAWLIPALSGHRFYFVVPWAGRVNIGTTDTDYSGDKDAPRAEAAEVAEILAAINAYFPEARLTPTDVISTWAGLRPLVSDPMVKATTAVSRKEEIFATDDGLITLAGGKLTTYRLMAERGIDLALQRLQRRFNVTARMHASSKDVIVSGGAIKRAEMASYARRFTQDAGCAPETAQHLIAAYGTDAQHVVELIGEDERLGARLLAGLPHIAAEIVYAARYEMALTLADALARRTRLAVLAGAASLQCATTAASLLARELDWDEVEVQRQRAQFAAEYELEYAPPQTPRARYSAPSAG